MPGAQLAYAQSMGDKPIRKKIDHLNQMAEFIKNNQTAVGIFEPL